MAYYTEIKRNNKIETKTIRLNFQTIAIYKRSQTEQTTYGMLPFTQNSKDANYSDRKQIQCRPGKRRGGRDYKGAQENCGNDENGHFTERGDGFTGIHLPKLIRLYA